MRPESTKTIRYNKAEKNESGANSEMKGRAKLLAAAGALAVLAGAWFLAESMARDQVEAAEAAVERELEPELIPLSVGEEADIRSLSWSHDGESVTLERMGTGTWQKADDPDCPINQSAAAKLLAAAGNITARSAIEKVTDLGPYGLTEPALTLSVTTTEETVSYAIGGQTLSGEYYLRMEGDDLVYTETGALLPAFDVTLDELVSMDTPPRDIGMVRSLSVTTDVAVYEMTYTDGDEEPWNGGAYRWFVTQGEERFPLAADQAPALYGEVTGIEFGKLVEWHGENLTGYGLGEPQGTASVVYIDRDGVEKTFTLEFGDYTGGDVYVRIAGSDRVYTADGGVLDRLMYPDWESMRPLDVLPADMEAVLGAEIRLGGHTYNVEIITETQENGEEVVCYVSNGWTLDADAAGDWFERLTSLEAESPAGEAAGREELIGVTLFRADETMPEVTVTLWGYDSGRCLCAVNETSRYFLSRSEGESLVLEAESFLIIE